MKKHQMELACALESHFLDHRSYPEDFQRLIPNYLSVVPMDIDDQPMRYQRTPDGRYAIYSVAYDLKDDGVPPQETTPLARTTEATGPGNTDLRLVVLTWPFP